MKQLTYHPFSQVFPMLADGELAELAADIKENGLREPIRTYQGKILDGRNRSAACLLAGVAPRYEPFKGTEIEALQFAWSVNFTRRHLTSSQRAGCQVDYEAQYADVVKLLKEEGVNGKRKGGGDKKSAKARAAKSVPQKIGEPIGVHDRETDAKLAAAMGTNRQYVSIIRLRGRHRLGRRSLRSGRPGV